MKTRAEWEKMRVAMEECVCVCLSWNELEIAFRCRGGELSRCVVRLHKEVAICWLHGMEEEDFAKSIISTLSLCVAGYAWHTRQCANANDDKHAVRVDAKFSDSHETMGDGWCVAWCFGATNS